MEGACLFWRVRRPYGCLPTHAGSPEGERMELFDKGEEGAVVVGGGYIATTIYSLCLGSFCNEMACVMEALSKQWAYSTCRGVSVRTGLNTIPLIQGCSPSLSFNRTIFYSLYCSLCVAISSALSASRNKCVKKLHKETETCGVSHTHVFQSDHVSLFTLHTSVFLLKLLCFTVLCFLLLMLKLQSFNFSLFSF